MVLQEVAGRQEVIHEYELDTKEPAGDEQEEMTVAHDQWMR